VSAPQAAAPAAPEAKRRPVLLRVEGLDVFYGGIHALKGVGLEVCEGELVTLIGCNGAGKSTTLKAIAGLLKPKAGRIEFLGEPISGGGVARAVPSHKLVERGLALCPEGRRIFPNLSVDENLDLGAYTRPHGAEVREDLERMHKTFPILNERAKQLAGTLSGGEQQMLAIARALMSRPKLLMLDEPSLGLAPKIVSRIFDVLVDLKSKGMTILLVEQNARKALEVAERGYVLETGRVIKAGPAKELSHDPIVQKAYLGG